MNRSVRNQPQFTILVPSAPTFFDSLLNSGFVNFYLDQKAFLCFRRANVNNQFDRSI